MEWIQEAPWVALAMCAQAVGLDIPRDSLFKLVLEFSSFFFDLSKVQVGLRIQVIFFDISQVLLPTLTTYLLLVQRIIEFLL